MAEPNHMLSAAIAAFNAGDLPRAESECRRIVARSPKEADAWAVLGEVAQRRGLHAEAEASFRECVALHPNRALGHTLLGEARLRQGDVRGALERFDKALKLDPDNVRALASKADAFLIRGQPPKARRLLEKHVARGHGGIELAVVLARAELDDGRPAEAAAVLGDRATTGASPGVQYRAGTVLGKAYEQLGRHDDAFAAWSAGNAAVRTDFDPVAFIRWTDEIIAAFPNAPSPVAAHTDDRPVFIVGMPRCGSTLIERILDAHPAVRSIGESGLVHDIIGALPLRLGLTEPYPACIADLDAAGATALGQIYIDGLGPGSERRVVDKNLLNHRHLGLIARILPKARVIHCRRHPLDICLSCFGEGLQPTVHPYATDLTHLGVAYTGYERLMAHWRSTSPLPILDVEYEAVTQDPESEVRRVLEFLELEWDDRCLRYHEAKSRTLTLSYEQVRKPVYRSAVRRHEAYGAHLAPLRAALGALVPETAP